MAGKMTMPRRAPVDWAAAWTTARLRDHHSMSTASAQGYSMPGPRTSMSTPAEEERVGTGQYTQRLAWWGGVAGVPRGVLQVAGGHEQRRDMAPYVRAISMSPTQ